MSLRERKKQKTQQAILEAARALIEREEFDSVTTRLIAETADVSYQTLYNYFPSKNDILIELLKENLVGSEETYQRIIRTFSGDVLDSLQQLNRSRLEFALAYRDPADEYINITMKIFTTTNHKLNLIESLDQFGGEQYQAILALARGMGVLQENTDIQLMAHTLQIISTYGVQSVLMSEVRDDASIFLDALNQQTEQLVRPYLLQDLD